MAMAYALHSLKGLGKGMAKHCKVFISYSHEDEMLKDSKVWRGAGYPRAFLSRLYAAIAAHDDLLTKDEIFFDDERLAAEPAWRPAIETALDECGLLIFLVSPHSVVSDFCMTKEVARAMERGINVITVLLRPSHDWYKVKVRNPTTGEAKALGEWHSGGLPKFGGNARPVSDWGDEEEAAWNNAVKHIVDFMQANPVTRATATPSDAVPEPWPEWPPEEALFLDDCRQRLVVCFRDQVLRRHLGVIFEHAEHRLPKAVGRALLVPPEKAGESVCKALLMLLNDLSRKLKTRTLAMSREDCAVVRDCFKAAFGAAARMCLDPVVMRGMELDGPEDAARCRRLPATAVAGATLAVRAEPHKSWKRPENIGGAALEDGRAIPVTIELGDTQSAGRSLALVLHQRCYPAAVSPTELDDQSIGWLRGEAEVKALLGEARYFVLPPEQDSRLTPELESWVVAQLATGVLVLQSANGAQLLFRYSEKTLLTLIGHALAILDEPEWNPS